MQRTRILFGLAVVLAACGGKTLESPENVGSDGGAGKAGAGGTASGGSGGSSAGGSSIGGSAGSSVGGADGGVSPSGCPLSSPPMNATCSQPGLSCTYGGNVLFGCRDMVACTGTSWAHAGACQEPPPGACPAAKPASSSGCGYEGADCGYDDGTICNCTSCPGPCTPDPPVWYCAGPPTTPGCPAIAPNLGSPCIEQGLQCSYGACPGMATIARCDQGAWVWDAVACPL